MRPFRYMAIALAIVAVAMVVPVSAQAYVFQTNNSSFNIDPVDLLDQQVSGCAACQSQSRSFVGNFDPLTLIDRATINGLVNRRTAFAYDENGDLIGNDGRQVFNLGQVGDVRSFFQPVGHRHCRGNNSSQTIRVFNNNGGFNSGTTVIQSQTNTRRGIFGRQRTQTNTTITQF